MPLNTHSIGMLISNIMAQAQIVSSIIWSCCNDSFESLQNGPHDLNGHSRQRIQQKYMNMLTNNLIKW